MNPILFIITPDEESEWMIARWDDPAGGGITTEAKTVPDLQAKIVDAVEGYFEAKGTTKPATVRLHFMEDPVLDMR